MGNTCYNINPNASPHQIGQSPHFKSPITDDFQANHYHNQDDYNPQTGRNSQKHKVHLSQKKKQKFNFQVKNSDCIRHIKQQYQKMRQSYGQHYIDQANQHAQNWEILVKQAKEHNLNYTPTQQQKALVERVKTEHQDVIFYQTQIQRKAWELKSDKNGIKISCRRQQDGTVGCRVQALCDVPFQILISIMIQVEFYKDYTPFLEVSRQEKQVARNCRIGYTQNYIPLFTKRQSFFQGIGYSRLNHPSKQIFLFTRSIHDKKDLQELLQFPVNTNPDYIQLDYKYFVVRYRPIKKDVGLVDIGMNVDTKMNLIPTWLMEKVAKQFGQKFFKNIVRISKNFKGSKWEKNVEKNPHLFLYFQRQIKQYLEKHNLS